MQRPIRLDLLESYPELLALVIYHSPDSIAKTFGRYLAMKSDRRNDISLGLRKPDNDPELPTLRMVLDPNSNRDRLVLLDQGQLDLNQFLKVSGDGHPLNNSCFAQSVKFSSGGHQGLIVNHAWQITMRRRAKPLLCHAVLHEFLAAGAGFPHPASERGGIPLHPLVTDPFILYVTRRCNG